MNSLPLYKWCQLILDGPVEHSMQVAFAIKFFKYFTSKSSNNPEYSRVGSYFFEGVINNYYFERIITKFKTIEDYYKDGTNESSLQKGFQEMFHAFGLWLKDMAVLDEKLHLPSLPPNMLPDLLCQVLEPSLKIDLNFIDLDDINRLVKLNCSEWRRLHFRNQSDYFQEKNSSTNSSPDKSPIPENQIEILMKRLSMYDSPTPFPFHKSLQTTVIPLCDTWFCDIENFENIIGPYVYALQSYGK